MNNQVLLLALLIGAGSCLRPFLKLAVDYKSLDEKIIQFIQNPTKDGWEDNILDMQFYVYSMQSIVRDLDGGLTLSVFHEAEKLLQGGKPNFISKVVDDEKFIMELNISDEQLERLYYMQKFADHEWEDFAHMTGHKKTMSNLLI